MTGSGSGSGLSSPSWMVRISGHRVNDSGTVFYHVRTKCTNSREHSVWRRFSDFVALHAGLKEEKMRAERKSRKARALPPLPSKFFKTSPMTREASLSDYMEKLMNLYASGEAPPDALLAFLDVKVSSSKGEKLMRSGTASSSASSGRSRIDVVRMNNRHAKSQRRRRSSEGSESAASASSAVSASTSNSISAANNSEEMRMRQGAFSPANAVPDRGLQVSREAKEAEKAKAAQESSYTSSFIASVHKDAFLLIVVVLAGIVTAFVAQALVASIQVQMAD